MNDYFIAEINDLRQQVKDLRGLETPAFTAGGVVFGAASGGAPTQDATNLFWDDTNNRLGIGTATPGVTLDVAGSVSATGGLNLGTQSGATAGRLFASGATQLILETAAANSVVTCEEIYRRTSGTAASGLGSQLVFNGETTTGSDQVQGIITAIWSNTPDTNRRGELRFSGQDSGGSREFIRGGSVGAATGIGFFGSAVAVKQTVTGTRTGTLAQLQTVVANMLTALSNYGLWTDSTT